MKKEIGPKIRKIRVSKEIDAKKVAVEIGIRDTSYSKIEREGTNSLETLLKIAHVLGVNIVEFFSDPHLVEEPREKSGYVTRDEWIQSNLEIIKTFKQEFAKFREDQKFAPKSYPLKNKIKGSSKKK